MRREHVLELAGMLSRDGSESSARLLLAALTNGQDVVALTMDDRRRMLAALDHPPAGLVELRAALFDEVNWRRTVTL